MCKREVEKEGVREVVGVSQDVARGGVKARLFSTLVLKELKEDDWSSLSDAKLVPRMMGKVLDSESAAGQVICSHSTQLQTHLLLC